MKKQKPGYVLFFWIGIVFSLFALSIFYYTGSDSPLIPFAVSVAVLYFAFAEADVNTGDGSLCSDKTPK